MTLSVVPGIKYMDAGKVVLEIPIDVDLSGYDIITLRLRREFLMIEYDDCKRLRRKFMLRTNGRDPQMNAMARLALGEAKLLCYNLATHIKELTDVINHEDSFTAVYKLAV